MAGSDLDVRTLRKDSVSVLFSQCESTACTILSKDKDRRPLRTGLMVNGVCV